MKLSRAQLRQLEEAGIEVDGRHKGTRPRGKSCQWNGVNPRKRRRKTQEHVTAQQRLFDQLCQAHGIPIPDHEYQFATEIGRKWRFDKCWGEFDLALEINGGNFIQGRHAQAAALRDEYEKLQWAVILGWFVIPCLPEDVQSGAIFPVIQKAMGLE